MATSRLMIRVGFMIACWFAAVGLSARGAQPVDRPAALRLFQERVEQYAALHRELEQSLPRLDQCPDPLAVMVARAQLAAALRRARPLARQGDIFSPEVAHPFRVLIAEALAGHDAARLLAELQEVDVPTPLTRPRVNECYPRGATHEVPVVLLLGLPTLPEDIEYRIVRGDLILWDIHANLVIDVLPDAFAAALSE